MFKINWIYVLQDVEVQNMGHFFIKMDVIGLVNLWQDLNNKMHNNAKQVETNMSPQKLMGSLMTLMHVVYGKRGVVKAVNIWTN